MNAVHNARDLLNSHKAKSTKSSATSWMNAMNGASAALQRPTSFDLNGAKSTGASDPTESFRAAMDKLVASPAKSAAPQTAEDAKLRKTAETLVNKMFVGTMLKSMRNSPFKDPTMSGGKAGEAYAGLFDQNIAEHAGGGIGTKLVDVLVKELSKHRSDPKQLHTDPKRDAKPVDPTVAARAAGAVKKPKRTDHDAVTVNLAA